MNPVFFLALFALFPLAKAAKEDWDTALVTNIYYMLILIGGLASWVLFPDFMKFNLNITGLVIWIVVLLIYKWNEHKSKDKKMGLADIYLGLALTVLLGLWVNFVMMAMSAALVVYTLVKIFKNPQKISELFKTKTKLVPFYLLGLIALIIYSFLA